jgi:nicotinate-nucleotide pyrophosphorylase (carboxylating)
VPTARLAGHLFDMLNEAAQLDRKPDFVEVEVDSLEQLEEVFKVVGVHVALLDNFSLDDLREAVRRRNQLGLSGKLALEASGAITLQTVRAVAETGVERIAVGALTHSAPAVDIGVDL